MMVSPAAARKIACVMVLQGAEADKQLLLSRPLSPFTYRGGGQGGWHSGNQ